LAKIFEDIKETLSLSSINSDYRTLGLWADYLEAAWNQLKPIVQTDEYKNASDNLRTAAQNLASRFPAIALSKKQVEDLGEDADEILKTTEKFERLLPSLIINISLLSLEWKRAKNFSNRRFPSKRETSFKKVRVNDLERFSSDAKGRGNRRAICQLR